MTLGDIERMSRRLPKPHELLLRYKNGANKAKIKMIDAEKRGDMESAKRHAKVIDMFLDKKEKLLKG